VSEDAGLSGEPALELSANAVRSAPVPFPPINRRRIVPPVF